MKKIIFIMFISLLGISTVFAENKNKVVLTGKITGISGKPGQCWINYQDSAGNYARHSFELKDQVLQTEFEVSHEQVVSVRLDKRFTKTIGIGMFLPCNASNLMFVAAPGQNVEINGDLKQDFVDIYPGGDRENDIFRKYTSAVHPLLNEMMNLSVKCQLDKSLSEAQKQEYQQKAQEYSKQIHQLCLDFIDRHVSSIGGLWLLDDMLLRKQISMEDGEQYFKKVDKKYRNTKYYTNIAMRIEGYKSAVVGQAAPDIRSTHTFDGKPFDLKEYRGKYVLIDFWGTWCESCITGMPDMKKFAEAHADKLVVLGIAQESGEKRWREYLEKSPWDWKQILSGKDEENHVLRYNVQGFPTKLLISPEGKILARSLGEEPAFYKELEQLIK